MLRLFQSRFLFDTLLLDAVRVFFFADGELMNNAGIGFSAVLLCRKNPKLGKMGSENFCVSR